jgi:predicted nucleic acid-binding protein
VGTLTLPDTGQVYLDASPIIYSVEKIEPYWSLLQPLWHRAQAGHVTLVSSQLLFIETLVKPLQAGDAVLEASFRNLLLNSHEVQLLPISLPILEEAARLRAALRLKTPDAIHAATAFAADCVLFITNDSDFRRVPGLPVTLLAEIAASNP